MKTAKLIVMYPAPKDVEVFERRYEKEHVPLAVEKLTGKIRFDANLITSAPVEAKAPYHRIAEIYFSTMNDLEDCLNSPGGQETIAHAIEISSGGEPLILVAEVEVFVF